MIFMEVNLKEKKLETIFWWIVFLLKFNEDKCPRCNKENFAHHGMGYYCTHCHLWEPIW